MILKALSDSAFNPMRICTCHYLETLMNFISNRWLLSAASISVAALVAACGGSSTPPPVAQATLVAVATPSSFLTSGSSTLSTTGGNGSGAVTYTVASGPCTASGSTLSATAAGTCSVTAKKAADTSYLEATSAAISVTVTLPYAALTVVQEQTATQNSYVAGDAPANAGTALPGNNLTGSYAWNQGGNDWWAGVGTDSVYKGIGAPANAGAGVGVYVKGAGTTTWSIDGATSMTVGLGTNPECVGICKATIILKSTTTDCIATIKTPITILTEKVNTGTSKTQVNGAVPTYSSTLTDANWTVTGCSANTMTAFKTLRVNEVHAQLLQANMQSTTPVGGPYANGVNLGAIKFQ
jgi:hypothetical protein